MLFLKKLTKIFVLIIVDKKYLKIYTYSMEKEEIDLLVAENQIKIDFDSLVQEPEEESTLLTNPLIKATNFDWIKDEVLFVVVKAYHSFVKDLPKVELCGKKLLDWVLNAGSGCETKVIEDCEDIIGRIRNINTNKKIIAVFYSDTPLLDRATFNKFCNYFSSRNINFLQLSRGFIVKTEFIKNNLTIAQGASELDDKNLLVANSSKVLNLMSSSLYSRIANYHIKNGVILFGQNTIFIDGDVEIEGGVIIYPNNIIKGQTIIGEGAILECGNVIKNSIISNGAVLKSSYIENSKISQGKTVEPFSKIIGQEL